MKQSSSSAMCLAHEFDSDPCATEPESLICCDILQRSINPTQCKSNFCSRDPSAALIGVGSEREESNFKKWQDWKTCRTRVCVRPWPSRWARSFPPFWVLCSAERCRHDDVLPATAGIMTGICLPQQNTAYANLEEQRRSLVHRPFRTTCITHSLTH